MTDSAMRANYTVTIGIECHVQLKTKTKLFSAVDNDARSAEPNTLVSHIDFGLPGALPVLNEKAVELASRAAFALDTTPQKFSKFDRKHYFYPDLPMGYQITQYDEPIIVGGHIDIFVGDERRTVRITRAHLEADAGKSTHPSGSNYSLVDLNRAGTPLLEIVTEPDMRSSVEAAEYAKTLHALVVWLGICDGNMQEGSFRCDVNVSVRKPGAPLGTRREIKNLNSFKFMQQAIDYEIRWQIEQIEDGHKIQQATVLFDPDSGETRMMRSKEDAHDYRYFPDPDLLPLVISADWIARVKGELPELPGQMRERFINDLGLSAYDATTLTASEYF